MKTLKISIILLFLFVMTIITIEMTGPALPEPQQVECINSPMLIALDSIAEQYIADGWTADAAYLIAGFEVDLYDESDTAEYRLYVGYMED